MHRIGGFSGGRSGRAHGVEKASHRRVDEAGMASAEPPVNTEREGYILVNTYVREKLKDGSYDMSPEENR